MAHGRSDIHSVYESVQNLIGGLPELKVVASYDYASFVSCIVNLEYEQEKQLLLKMVEEDAATFENRFRERCRFRETNTDQTIPFSERPNTPANRLYWAIASCLKPQNMKEILQILMPSVTKQWVVSDLPLTALPRSEWKEIKPTLKSVSNIDALTELPTLLNFFHYLIVDGGIFDLRDIENYSLPIHANFQKFLQKEYPNIAKNINDHNQAFAKLNEDIHTYNNKGVMPRQMIQRLIRVFELSGTRLTRAELAAPAANDAAIEFLAYFYALPDDLQSCLIKLSDGNVTLGKVIENIKKNECVETSATHLKQILDFNLRDSFLDTAPLMTELDLKMLESKYKKTLDTEKGKSTKFSFPERLTEAGVMQIEIHHVENLVLLLLNFPQTHYQLLWRHLVLPSEVLYQLPEVIESNLFSQPGQQQTLLKAILDNYPWVNQHESLWRFVSKFSSEWAGEVLLSMLEEESVSGLRKLSDSCTVLHILASFDPEQFVATLEKIPEEDLYEALMALTDTGETVLHVLALINPEQLVVILEKIPEENRFDALIVSGNDGYTALDTLVDEDPEQLVAAFEKIPEEDRFYGLIHLNCDGYTVLHALAGGGSPEQLAVILEGISEEKCLEALMSFDVNDNDTVLHLLAMHHPGLLVQILETIPAEKRLEVLMVCNNDKEIVLDFFTRKGPEQLVFILENIPEEERLKALMVVNEDGCTLLHLLAVSDRAQQLAAIFESIPAEKRLRALMFPDGDGVRVRDLLAESHPALLEFILKNIRESDARVSELGTWASTARRDRPQDDREEDLEPDAKRRETSRPS